MISLSGIEFCLHIVYIVPLNSCHQEVWMETFSWNNSTWLACNFPTWPVHMYASLCLYMLFAYAYEDGCDHLLFKVLIWALCLPWNLTISLRKCGVLGNNSPCFNNRNNTNSCAIVFQQRPHPQCYLCWLAWSTRNSKGMKSPAFFFGVQNILPVDCCCFLHCTV